MSILTLMGLIPLVGAIIVGFLPMKPSQAKTVALIFALGAMAVAIIVGFTYDPSSADPFQFVENTEWIPALGISFSVGIDGIGLILIFLTTGLVPIVIIAGWRDVEDAEAVNKTKSGSVKGYFALMLALEALTIGIFISLDVFLFYVFFEVILIPVYFMIGRYGTGRRSYAAVKFMIYSFLGGMVMLAGLAGLWFLSIEAFDGPNLYLPDLLAMEIDPTWQTWLFWSFFIAFAIKAPMWPVHTWLPDASGSATPGTAVLLIAVLDKIGTFGMLRLCLPLFPDAAQQFAPIIVAFAVISIFYGALVAIGQTDMKRLFGYISISHFGFIVLGIFVFTTQAQSGATFYMLGHGLSVALLVLMAGYLMRRKGSTQIDDYGGVVTVAPVLAGLFLVAGLVNVALPGMLTFVSEFLVLVGTFERYPWVGAFATLAIVLAALYILLLYQRVMTGPKRESTAGIKDLNLRERWIMAPLVLAVIFLGFYPAPMLDIINPAVDNTMEWVGATDPPPTIADATEGGNQ
ncbi:MAG: NADH-quinone oxidoreductase subunit M [Actinobacteria bacterium]|nr:NADH-quinone oxidoreductase subunit M [Actinomycetota bacterium]